MEGWFKLITNGSFWKSKSCQRWMVIWDNVGGNWAMEFSKPIGWTVNTTNVLARVLDIKRWLVTGVTNLLHIELDAKYVVNLLKSSIYTKLLMEPQFLLTTKTFKRWFLTQDYWLCLSWNQLCANDVAKPGASQSFCSLLELSDWFRRCLWFEWF